jgi:MFS family permease
MERSGDHKKAVPVDPATPTHGFVGQPIFWFLGIGFALLALVHGVALHHLLPLLFERGVASEVAVVAASFIGPMQVAGRLAMMAAEKHVSNNGIAVTCFIVMGCSILLLIGADTTPTLLVGFVILFGGGYGVVSIIRPVIARDILGQQNFGAKSGALALLYLAGSASAPFLGSLIWQLGGYELVLPSLIVMAAIGLILYLLSNKLSLRDHFSL